MSETKKLGRKKNWSISQMLGDWVRVEKSAFAADVKAPRVGRFLPRSHYLSYYLMMGSPGATLWDKSLQKNVRPWKNLLARLAMKHKFTTMYKPNINGLVKRTNRTLCSMLAKKAEIHVNICDWDLKIHHVVWVYNTTYKIVTWYSPFRLTYEMKTFLLIELEVMTLRTTTMMRLPLDEPQHHRLLQLNELDELQLRAYQSIEVA
jgi:hypothetical protein